MYSRFMNPKLIKLCFLDKRVFRKLKYHKIVVFRIAESGSLNCIRIGGSRSLNCIMDF